MVAAGANQRPARFKMDETEIGGNAMSDYSKSEGPCEIIGPIISRMPALPTVDVPNGTARDKGEGAADRCCQTGQYKSNWGGNRTGE